MLLSNTIDRQISFFKSFNRPHLFFTIFWYFVDDGQNHLGFILFSPHRNKNVFITLRQYTFQHWKNNKYAMLIQSLAFFSDHLPSTTVQYVFKDWFTWNYSFWGWLHSLKILHLLNIMPCKFKNNNKPPTHISRNISTINYFLLKLFWSIWIWDNYFIFILCWHRMTQKCIRGWQKIPFVNEHLFIYISIFLFHTF